MVDSFEIRFSLGEKSGEVLESYWVGGTTRLLLPLTTKRDEKGENFGKTFIVRMDSL